MDWLKNAACREADPEMFFPLADAARETRTTLRAIGICRNCSVRVECLAFADTNHVIYGIWGGLTEEQRETRSRVRALV